MDIITLHDPEYGRRVLYRKSSEHTFHKDTENVLQIIHDQDELVFPYKAMTIDNITGKFKDFLRKNQLAYDLAPLMFLKRNKSRTFYQIYHIEATLTIHKDIVHFKGCNSTHALDVIADDIGLYHNQTSVYMVLLTGNLGRNVDVSFGCYIERIVSKSFTCVFPRVRIIDIHSVIYLEVTQWNTKELVELDPRIHPVKVLITISSRGSVVQRFTWKNIHWDSTTEKEIVRIGQWWMDLIQSLC
jgi:hypothetical protein